MAYVGLTLAGLLLALSVWPRHRLTTMVALLVVSGTLIDWGDIMALLLKLYHYQPGLLPAPVADARLGALLSDYLFVPLLTATLFGMTRHHRFEAALLLVSMFVAVEVAFVHLGIFVHTGWNTWYTAVLFCIESGGIIWWLGRFERDGYTPLHRIILIGATLHYQWVVLTLLMGGVLGKFLHAPHLLPDPERDNVLGGVLLNLVPYLALAGTWVWRRWCEQWTSTLLLGGIWFGWVWLLQAFGLRHDAPGWGALPGALLVMLLTQVSGWLDMWFARSTVRLPG